MDDEAATLELIARHGLTFPVGHSADARAIASATGAFINEDPLFLQSTGFVLDPEGRVVVSVYSSGAIGRLVPDDVVGLIGYVRGASGVSCVVMSEDEAPMSGRARRSGLSKSGWPPLSALQPAGFPARGWKKRSGFPAGGAAARRLGVAAGAALQSGHVAGGG